MSNGKTAQDHKDAFAKMAKAKDDSFTEMTSDYFKFTKIGEVALFRFVGFATTTMRDREVKVVKLVDKDGIAFINGDKMLVSSCERIEAKEAYIKVTYNKDVETETAGQSYKDLTVQVFNQ
jgi:hypothetical protein